MVVDTVALTKGLKIVFNKTFQAGKITKYKELMFKVPSTSDKETYGFFGNCPSIREWVGERHADYISDYEFEIINKNFESTIAVDRNEVEDDLHGMISTKVKQLSAKAKAYPDTLISDLVKASLTGLAYDEAAYCSNRAAPNDNLLAGNGVTEANLLTDLATARAAMMNFVDDKGDPMDIRGDTIVCHPGEETFFMKIAKSTSETVGVYSPWKELIKAVIVDPRLTDDNDWYLFASSELLKPFVFQNRKSPEFVALDKPSDESVFMRRKILYGVDMRCNAGYGLFQHCIQTVNA